MFVWFPYVRRIEFASDFVWLWVAYFVILLDYWYDHCFWFRHWCVIVPPLSFWLLHYLPRWRRKDGWLGFSDDLQWCVGICFAAHRTQIGSMLSFPQGLSWQPPARKAHTMHVMIDLDSWDFPCMVCINKNIENIREWLMPPKLAWMIIKLDRAISFLLSAPIHYWRIWLYEYMLTSTSKLKTEGSAKQNCEPVMKAAESFKFK